MKNFKTHTTVASGLAIMLVLLLIPISESKSKAGSDAIKLLATVAHNHAQEASQEASRAAEKQRALVKSLIGKAIGGAANDGDNSPQTGRLTPREIAREKVVLQQLEAHAKSSAEVLESVKRLAAELERKAPR